ncbi:MAG TPA: RNA methyltransferase [Candidatus Saccharimonadales bacterium]|jgi:tRNA G18 (ribose-2'-O)-methylase SpoU|nr:RNA methyltransferase [Candidatus Saccharimonadales bacterium]
MPRCNLIIHNIRSCYNVGSLLRTAEGLGVEKLYLTGYTPYPLLPDDYRLPFLAQKTDRQIHKTALGAELIVDWEHVEDIFGLIVKLKTQKYQIVGLEQAHGSVPLNSYQPDNKLALILGQEIGGIDPAILALTDMVIEIPMFGKKDSFNVAQAAAIALYHIKTFNVG